MRNAEKIMKMSPVSQVLWFVQLLSACAIHHNATSKQSHHEITSNPSSPVEEFPTKGTLAPELTMPTLVARIDATTTETQRSSTNAEGMEKSSDTTSHRDHRFVSFISSNAASTVEENIETGTRSAVFTMGFETEGFTSQEIVNTEHATSVNNLESGTSLQTERTDQTTSWTKERSEAIETQTEADGTTMSLDNLRNKSEKKQSDKGNYNSTFAQYGQAHTKATPATTPFKVDNKTSIGNSTTGNTNALPSSKHGVGSKLTTGFNVETLEVVSVTQVTSSNSENVSSDSLLTTQEPPVSSMFTNTDSPVPFVTITDQTFTENETPTVPNVVHTTWTGSVPTQNTESLSVSTLTTEGNYNFKTIKRDLFNYNTTQSELDTNNGNQTTPGNSSDGMINTVSSAEHVTSGNYVTTHLTQVMSSEHKNVSMRNTEEPLDSTTSANTVASSQSTARNMDSDSYSTGRNQLTRTETKPTPSHSIPTSFPVNVTITSSNTEATSRNVSSEAEQAVWPDCFSNIPSSKIHRSSKLICFITLWSLGMTASIFLGLTVFLWVRLSVVRKKAKIRGRGDNSTGKERQSLWATHNTPEEERVEFWYTNGSTLEADKKAREQVRAKRNDGRQKEGKDGDMWIQPTVTAQDIAEFWYANGRARNAERVEVQQDQL